MKKLVIKTFSILILFTLLLGYSTIATYAETKQSLKVGDQIVLSKNIVATYTGKDSKGRNI